jgi:hypothetical protein
VLIEFKTIYINYLKPFNPMMMAAQDDNATNCAKFYMDDNLSNTLKRL